MVDYIVKMPDHLDDKLVALTVLLNVDRATVFHRALELLYQSAIADEVNLIKNGKPVKVIVK